jgi:hypothetical protein
MFIYITLTLFLININSCSSNQKKLKYEYSYFTQNDSKMDNLEFENSLKNDSLKLSFEELCLKFNFRKLKLSKQFNVRDENIREFTNSEKEIKYYVYFSERFGKKPILIYHFEDIDRTVVYFNNSKAFLKEIYHLIKDTNFIDYKINYRSSYKEFHPPILD